MTSTAASAGATRSTLVDIGSCIGCRACQVACKQWNDKDGESTTLDDTLGFQNPAMLSAKTLTLITFHEMVNDKAQGGVDYAFEGAQAFETILVPATQLDPSSCNPLGITGFVQTITPAISVIPTGTGI